MYSNSRIPKITISFNVSHGAVSKKHGRCEKLVLQLMGLYFVQSTADGVNKLLV